MDNIEVYLTYEILSDCLGWMTVAFLYKWGNNDEWKIIDIYVDESYSMLHRIEELKKGGYYK